MVSPLLERGDNQRGDGALRERPEEGRLSQGRPLSEAGSFSDEGSLAASASSTLSASFASFSSASASASSLATSASSLAASFSSLRTRVLAPRAAPAPRGGGNDGAVAGAAGAPTAVVLSEAEPSAPLGAAAVERLQLACSLAREEREACIPGERESGGDGWSGGGGGGGGGGKVGGGGRGERGGGGGGGGGGASSVLGAHLLDCWTSLVCEHLGADARWLVSARVPLLACYAPAYHDQTFYGYTLPGQFRVPGAAAVARGTARAAPQRAKVRAGPTRPRRRV